MANVVPVTVSNEDAQDIVRRLGHLPAWGVVSTFAAESFYENLTYEQAVRLAREEASREPGRTASVVLTISTEVGMPLS